MATCHRRFKTQGKVFNTIRALRGQGLLPAEEASNCCMKCVLPVLELERLLSRRCWKTGVESKEVSRRVW